MGLMDAMAKLLSGKKVSESEVSGDIWLTILVGVKRGELKLSYGYSGAQNPLVQRLL